MQARQPETRGAFGGTGAVVVDAHPDTVRLTDDGNLRGRVRCVFAGDADGADRLTGRMRGIEEVLRGSGLDQHDADGVRDDVVDLTGDAGTFGELGGRRSAVALLGEFGGEGLQLCALLTRTAQQQ